MRYIQTVKLQQDTDGDEMLKLQEELNQLEKLEMKSESIDNVINRQDSEIVAMLSKVEEKAISNDSDLFLDYFFLIDP